MNADLQNHNVAICDSVSQIYIYIYIVLLSLNKIEDEIALTLAKFLKANNKLEAKTKLS